jgi:hypothetical protein
MRLFQKKLPRNCNLLLASCTHIGSILTHYAGLEQLKDELLSDPTNRLIFMGDLCEAILVDDVKRFDPKTQDLTILTPGDQYQRFIDIFKPCAKQILYINTGNHDYKHIKTIDLVEWVCQQLKVPYGTYSSKLTVLDSKGRSRFKIYTTHGNGSISSIADDPIRKLANMKLGLKRKLAPLAADCYLQAMAHTHKLIVSPPERELYITDNGEALKQNYTVAQQDAEYIPAHLRWYINTGSFLKNQILGASGYAERAMYAPVELGYARVVIEDYQIVNAQKVLA